MWKSLCTEKAAIFILPRKVALGRAGDYYIKGWDKKDEKRLEKATSKTTETELSKDTAVDSLNSSSDMEDLLKW